MFRLSLRLSSPLASAMAQGLVNLSAFHKYFMGEARSERATRRGTSNGAKVQSESLPEEAVEQLRANCVHNGNKTVF